MVAVSHYSPYDGRPVGPKNTKPAIVAVSGFSSNVGKTTLVCELLRALPEWEAIKVTRGHHRSCGRDPAACCVSELLDEQPVVRSGRDANYEIGKDTGRFWDSGAANVHWVIVTDGQVQRGLEEALGRVKAPGVIVEGNSFLDYISADMVIMCARSDGGKVKASARKALSGTDCLYLSSRNHQGQNAREQFQEWLSTLPIDLSLNGARIVTEADLPQLTAQLKELPYRQLDIVERFDQDDRA